ncbi:right-handed parallel beta-helix repeat-containing protein [Roseomonas sp. HJA6]|uniref:Right-handed parallel beta-helix repeat-containing protein n=1 Tax=Roseomonas alba TaxID=2846776 RepID=A0ABS7ADT4_9PROT|nr:Calx-beta domain-containing protein [Neoroseomonas alba]MBW6400465.1 right-handed parallel beta-helix repeat-containing protein [Neoroseomonas alba]
MKSDHAYYHSIRGDADCADFPDGAFHQRRDPIMTLRSSRSLSHVVDLGRALRGPDAPEEWLLALLSHDEADLVRGPVSQAGMDLVFLAHRGPPEASADSVIEAAGNVAQALSDTRSGVALAPAATTNNDATIGIAALDASNTEGSDGTTPFTFLVTRTGGISAAHAATWRVTGSGAAPAVAADFAGGVLPTGRVRFDAGETTKVVTINVAADVAGELNERFQVTLSNPSAGATIGSASAGALILDDDGLLSVAPAGMARAEGNGGGATEVAFLVTRTADLGQATTLTWSVAGSGASPVNGADFAGGALPSGTLSFAAGEGSRIVTLRIAADAVHEAVEALRFTVSGTVTGQAFAPSTTQTILNDDAPASPLDPRVIYVDPTAAAGGDGSMDRPLQSLDGVTLLPGDMALLRGGTVSKSFVITDQGMPDRPIVIGSYGVGNARVDGTVVLSGARYVALTNLDIEPGDGYGVVLTNATGFSTVDNCSIHGGEIGVVVRGNVADGNVISGNRIYENDGMGVWLDSTDLCIGAATLVSGNTIYRNGQQGIALHAGHAIVEGNTVVNNGLAGLAGMSAIHVVGTASHEAHGNVIRNNIIAHQRDGASYDGNGIQLDHWSDDTLVIDNLVFGNDGCGINVFAASGSVVAGNIVHGNMVDSGGTHVIAMAEIFFGEALFAPGYSQHNVITGNTVFATHPDAAAIQVQEVVTAQTSNIITGNALGRSGPGALWIWGLQQGTSLDDWNALALVGNDAAAVAPATPAIDAAMLDRSFTPHSGLYGAHDPEDMTQEVAGPGHTDILGSPHGSWMSAGGMDATLSAFAGDNQLAAGSGETTLRGGPGNDGLFGGAGNHRIFAGTGGAVITGGSGSSLLVGGPGDDIIYAGNGTLPDTIDGGGGTNTLVAGGGIDTFVIGAGVSYIYEFATGQDRLDVSSLGARTLADLDLLAGGEHSVVLDKGGVVRAFLVGVDATNMPPDSFILAHSDHAAILSITAAPAPKLEGNSGTTRYAFAVTRSGDLSVAHSVRWSTEGITGKEGGPADASDFAAGVLPSGTLQFAPGQATRSIVVEVAADSTLERTETFAVRMTEPSSGATIGTALAFGTIRNDDAQIDLVSAGAANAEGQAGSDGAVVFTALRSGRADGAASANWSVEISRSGGANEADFVGGVLPNGTVTFAPGARSASIVVPVAGDSLIEGDQRFTLHLTDPSTGVSIGRSSVTGIIRDDDMPGSGTLSVVTPLVARLERTGATTTFAFDVVRSADLSLGASVDWAVHGGGVAGIGAASASDFGRSDMPAGKIDFAPGQDVQTVLVKVSGDRTGEQDEAFTFVLSGPAAGVALAKARAVAVITNDDPITGTAANETIRGFETADIFVIGGSRDTVIGKDGTDTFRFQQSAIGAASTNGTTIEDFRPQSGEKLDLAAIDAIACTEANDAFHFIGTAAFSGRAGELRWTDIGALRLIEGDIDADRSADLSIVVIATGVVDVSWFVL